MEREGQRKDGEVVVDWREVSLEDSEAEEDPFVGDDGNALARASTIPSRDDV